MSKTGSGYDEGRCPKNEGRGDFFVEGFDKKSGRMEKKVLRRQSRDDGQEIGENVFSALGVL